MNKPPSGRPRWISKRQLMALGLTMLRSQPLVVQCQSCGVEWRPLREPHRPTWQCYNGCNVAKQDRAALAELKENSTGW
jgi:hypothetical protein